MRRTHSPLSADVRRHIDPAIFIFSLAFFLGILAGYFLCCAMDVDTDTRKYLEQYAQVLSTGGTITAASALGVAAAYFRTPLAVFLCSVFPYAFFLQSGVFLVEGFLLSFAVTNLSLALGSTGVLVALCVFGVRSLFILPLSLSIALGKRGLQKGRRMRKKAVRKRKVYVPKFVLYLLILASGIFVELTLVPRLAAFALQHIS